MIGTVKMESGVGDSNARPVHTVTTTTFRVASRPALLMAAAIYVLTAFGIAACSYECDHLRKGYPALEPHPLFDLARSPRSHSNTTQLIKKFVKCGEDPNALQEESSTIQVVPLDAALQTNYWDPDVVRTLIDAGADVNLRDRSGGTPLLRMCGWVDYAEKASLLVEFGADVNAATPNGFTPIFCALGMADLQALRLFLGRGAQPNTRISPSSDTPLHWASKVEEARLLLDFGADPTARNSAGDTPLEQAKRLAQKGEARKELIQYLRDRSRPIFQTPTDRN